MVGTKAESWVENWVVKKALRKVDLKAERMVALKDVYTVEHWVDMMAVTKVD